MIDDISMVIRSYKDILNVEKERHLCRENSEPSSGECGIAVGLSEHQDASPKKQPLWGTLV